MIDTVEIQQIITNLPLIEKTAASSHVLAANSNAITQKEMEIVDETKLNTVVELSETLEAVNDKEKEKKENNKEEENKKEISEENEEDTTEEFNKNESKVVKKHIDIKV